MGGSGPGDGRGGGGAFGEDGFFETSVKTDGVAAKVSDNTFTVALLQMRKGRGRKRRGTYEV